MTQFLRNTYVLWITFCQFRNLLKYQNQSVPYCEIKNNTILGGIWKCGRENKWKVPSFFSICRLQFSFRSRDCRRGSQKIKWLQDRSRNDVQLFRKCLVVHLSSFFLLLVSDYYTFEIQLEFVLWTRTKRKIPIRWSMRRIGRDFVWCHTDWKSFLSLWTKLSPSSHQMNLISIL